MITFAKFWRKTSSKTGKVYYQGSGAGDARFLLFENTHKTGPDDPDLILKVVEKPDSHWIISVLVIFTRNIFKELDCENSD